MTKKTIEASKFNIDNSMISPDALYVVKKLQENGFDGIIVGGGIRDLLLHKKPKDFDVVTNATPEAVKKLFKRNSVIIGKRFKIVHIIFEKTNYDKIIHNRPLIEKHIIEISTYRSLKVHGDAINEFGRIMVDNNYGKQSDDAKRRDFTINSLYYNPIREIIIDYHNGLEDLANNTIRIIGDPEKRFIEDPVRILRAIRLSVKLGLKIDEDTLEFMHKTKGFLANENKGRLFEEMLKILLSGRSHECINRLANFGLPHGVFPLFEKLFFGKQKNELELKVLDKTDDRLQADNSVSTIFILSSLLWNSVYEIWQKLILQGSAPRQSLLEAISMNRDYAIRLGLMRNIYNSMSEVWMLQFDFENPNLRKLDKVLAHSRFRQGLHLYNLRMELGMVAEDVNNWWNKLIELDNDDAKQAHIEQLKYIFNNKPKPSKRRKKRKSAKSSSNEV